MKDEFSEYRVYSNGMVWSHVSGKMLKQWLDKDGYKRVELSSRGEQFPRAVHRLVAAKYLGAPNRRQVNHKNGVKTDNRVSNLEWVTHGENMLHAAKTGLTKRGEAHAHSKLSEMEVLEIRRLCAEGLTPREVSLKFKVGRRMCSDIVNRKNWRHI